jgi:hypothetical protein
MLNLIRCAPENRSHLQEESNRKTGNKHKTKKKKLSLEHSYQLKLLKKSCELRLIRPHTQHNHNTCLKFITQKHRLYRKLLSSWDQTYYLDNSLLIKGFQMVSFDQQRIVLLVCGRYFLKHPA